MVFSVLAWASISYVRPSWTVCPKEQRQVLLAGSMTQLLACPLVNHLWSRPLRKGAGLFSIFRGGFFNKYQWRSTWPWIGMAGWRGGVQLHAPGYHAGDSINFPPSPVLSGCQSSSCGRCRSVSVGHSAARQASSCDIPPMKGGSLSYCWGAHAKSSSWSRSVILKCKCRDHEGLSFSFLWLI